MEITKIDIKILPNTGTRLCGVASVVLDGWFVVHDIKIIKGAEKMFIAMPSREYKEATFRDIAHPINQDCRDYFQREILNQYQIELKNYNDNYIPGEEDFGQEEKLENMEEKEEKEEKKEVSNGLNVKIQELFPDIMNLLLPVDTEMKEKEMENLDNEEEKRLLLKYIPGESVECEVKEARTFILYQLRMGQITEEHIEIIENLKNFMFLNSYWLTRITPINKFSQKLKTLKNNGLIETYHFQTKDNESSPFYSFSPNGFQLLKSRRRISPSDYNKLKEKRYLNSADIMKSILSANQTLLSLKQYFESLRLYSTYKLNPVIHEYIPTIPFHFCLKVWNVKLYGYAIRQAGNWTGLFKRDLDLLCNSFKELTEKVGDVNKVLLLAEDIYHIKKMKNFISGYVKEKPEFNLYLNKLYFVHDNNIYMDIEHAIYQYDLEEAIDTKDILKTENKEFLLITYQDYINMQQIVINEETKEEEGKKVLQNILNRGIKNFNDISELLKIINYFFGINLSLDDVEELFFKNMDINDENYQKIYQYAREKYSYSAVKILLNEYGSYLNEEQKEYLEEKEKYVFLH